MKKHFILFFFLVNTCSSYTQIKPINKIIGRVISNETKSPLEYCTISIYQSGEKKLITGCTSDKSGNFILKRSF